MPAPPPDCRQWEVWQVDWEHFDDGESKERPALVVSSSKFNRERGQVYFAKISSACLNDPYRFTLLRAVVGTEAGLRKDCFVYLGTIRCFELSSGKILFRRGRLPQVTAELAAFTVRRLVGWKEPGEQGELFRP